jgi:hypothetical protein
MDTFVAGLASTYNCLPCNNPLCMSCPTSQGTCAVCFGNKRDPTNNCACPTGYFDDYSQNNKNSMSCFACATAACSSCSGSPYTTCLSCFGTNRDLTNNCACDTGNLVSIFVAGQPSTYNCVTCANLKCLSCPTSAYSCQTCVDSSRSTPDCGCNTGYADVFVYGQSNTYACQQCTNSLCQTCPSSPSVCTSCVGKFLF